MSFRGGRMTEIARCASFLFSMTILLAPCSYARQASFDMPACDRMSAESATSDPSAASDFSANASGSGANLQQGPAPILVNTSSGATAATASAPPTKEKRKSRKDKDKEKTAKADNNQQDHHIEVKSEDLLQPLKLTDDKDSYAVSKDGKIKLQAQRNVKTSDTPTTPDAGTTSIVNMDTKLNNKLLKDARKENIQPLALIESAGEAQQKLDIIGEADKQQLTDLWSSTINRSPDVQFVINRMQPHSDPNHATSTVIKLLSGVLFSAAQAVPMMMGPGVGTMVAYGGIGSGGSMVQQLLWGNEQKNQKKQQISQEQATMLYKMVRDTADKLVIEFRNYKKCRSQFDRASKLLDDVKAMVAAARDAQNPAQQIEMEYTIRKCQHDLDDITDDARLHRQQLCDLAGADAVAKLDEQIDEEALAVANATGSDAMAQAPAQPADNQAAPVKTDAAVAPAAPAAPAAAAKGAVPKQLAGNAQLKTN